MFDELLTEMEEKMNIYELEPPMLPRKRYILQKLEYSTESSENLNITTPKYRLKAIYFETLDTLVRDLDELFKQPGFARVRMLEEALLLDPEKWSSATEDVLNARLAPLLEIWAEATVYLPPTPPPPTILLRSYPEVLNILRLLVIPATSATAERLFSLFLMLLKSYFRSTMTHERLNNLAILHCYQDMVDKIDVRAFCREFCCNPCRVSVLGKAFEKLFCSTFVFCIL
ncbi:hypothetical protein PR048_028533, partial [Dryococelus australis]